MLVAPVASLRGAARAGPARRVVRLAPRPDRRRRRRRARRRATSRRGSARRAPASSGRGTAGSTVYDEVTDVDPAALVRFARELSSRLGAVVVALVARARPGRADDRARPRRDRRRVPLGARVLRPAAARRRDRAGREPHRARAAHRGRPADGQGASP